MAIAAQPIMVRSTIQTRSRVVPCESLLDREELFGLLFSGIFILFLAFFSDNGGLDMLYIRHMRPGSGIMKSRVRLAYVSGFFFKEISEIHANNGNGGANAVSNRRLGIIK